MGNKDAEMETFPDISDVLQSNCKSRSIADVIEFFDDFDSSEYDELLIPDNILSKRGRLLDIVTKESKRSCCFTKAYGHYVEGTGSIYCPFNSDKIVSIKDNENDFFNKMKDLKLRYFSPTEIARLMNFPEKFSFPSDLNCKQKYRLLGNSINVKVVSLLLKVMVYGDNLSP